uniref:E3 ubiquitin-protein ligase TRAIP n=1 Tax=Erigeron canadensis TaxID=72917 RepID=UPI001CB94833|nr:E3 ubiquitin-protein ligase TRAIP [Erigeron canadensis]
MSGTCNESTTQQPFSKTICSICYEDLKPIVEDLQAISICGHVFHELCIQQWFEYCSKGKKKCPICNQTCSASHVGRLYFQSVGDTNDPKPSLKLRTHKDPEELQLECSRLEGKVTVLNSALKIRENDLKNIGDELSACKEQLKREEAHKNKALEENHRIIRSLDFKEQELNKSDLECIKLKERSMALAKELAEVKLALDHNLDMDEIVKYASLATQTHTRDNMNVLEKSLMSRNQQYKMLMAKYSILSSEKDLSCQNLREAEVEIKKLKSIIKEMDKANEDNDNEYLRSLKASKKSKGSSRIRNEALPTFTHTCTSQDTIKESDDHSRNAKRSRGLENESNKKDGAGSYIIIDDDAPEVSVSPEYDSISQPAKRATFDASYSSKPTHETSKQNGVPLPLHEIGQPNLMPNITNEASLPAYNSLEVGEFCFSAGLIGPDGRRRALGKWCKKGQNKGLNSSSLPSQVSGDLISVGADGRGGTIKVLKSQNQASFDSNGSSFPAKNLKFSAKTNSLQSRGCLQINHFFSKVDQ